MRRRLAEADPSNAGWQRDLSVSLIRIALLKEQQDGRSEALPHAEEALTITERLAVLDPSNAAWQKDVDNMRPIVTRLRG